MQIKKKMKKAHTHTQTWFFATPKSWIYLFNVLQARTLQNQKKNWFFAISKNWKNIFYFYSWL